jgi:hypothetical protein
MKAGLYLGDGVAWLESLPDDYLDGKARRLGLECWSWEIDPEKYQLALERHKQIDLFEEVGE